MTNSPSTIFINILELAFYSFSLFSFLLLLVLLPGFVLGSLLNRYPIFFFDKISQNLKSWHSQAMATLGLSSLFYYFVIFFDYFAGKLQLKVLGANYADSVLQTFVITKVLVTLMLFLGGVLAYKKIVKLVGKTKSQITRASSKKELGEIIFLLAFAYLYLLLCISLSSFPNLNLREISSASTSYLTNLPIDNLIPYNLSRHLIDGLTHPNKEVVPGWQLADRGPLGAVFTSIVFLILDIRENSHWLQTSPVVYFIYQYTMSFLNLLGLFAGWCFVRSYFSKRTATLFLLLISFNYFFFINILFSWPKFLMAFFVLLGFYISQVLNNGDHNFQALTFKDPLKYFNKIAQFSRFASYLWVGVFFALACLSHDSAIFYFAGILCIVFCSKIFEKNNFKISNLQITNIKNSFLKVLFIICGFGITAIPWAAFKKINPPKDTRLLYLHLVCDESPETLKLSLGDVLKKYYEKHGVSGILAARRDNLVYPFDIRPIFRTGINPQKDPMSFLQMTSSPSFLNLVYSLGMTNFLFFLLFIKNIFSKSINFRSSLDVGQSKVEVLKIITLSFSGLIFLALGTGCSPYQFGGGSVNHVWVYPCYLVIFALIAAFLLNTKTDVRGRFSISKVLKWAFAGISIGLNLLYLGYIFFVASSFRPFLHASTGYIFWQIFLVIIIFGLLAAALLWDREDSV